MPSLSSAMSGVEATWGDQIDKGSLRGIPFWIHGARPSDYRDYSDPKNDGPDGRLISIIICDITLNGPTRKDPHAVITLGQSTEREPMLAYFIDHSEPLGPCHTFEVALKAGRTFWRIEDYDEEVINALGFQDQFDANGQRMLAGGK